MNAHATWQAALAMAAIAILPVVLLRRRPLAALTLLLASSLAAVLTTRRWHAPLASVLAFGQAALIVLAGLALCFVAATRPRRVSVIAAVATIGVQAADQAIRLSGRHVLDSSPLLAVTLIMVTAWLIGHSIRQAHNHTDTLRAQASAQAVTAERLQIARDLHDQVAHAIGIIAIQAGVGNRVIDTQPERARDALTAIEATSRQTLAGLRQTVRTLRQPGTHSPLPGFPAGLTGPGLAGPGLAGLGLAGPGLAGLGQLADATRDAGVHVDIQWHGERRPLPEDVDTCAFRIIQESVTNVVRHAGTGRCHLLIDQTDDELRIEVTDDGRDGGVGSGVGSGSAGSGYGIAGMRERVALLHGQLTAGPRPEGGFLVTARLPVTVTAR